MKNKEKLISDRHISKQGFTLVEVVLVMTITAIVFLAVYMLYANTVKYDVETRYEIIASNLAQEGVEMLRNMRDEEQLANNTIDNAFVTTPCQPFFDSNGSSDCGNARRLEMEFVAGSRYRNCLVGGCGAGQQTPFERRCEIRDKVSDPVSGDCVQLTIECVVSWDSFVNLGIRRDVTATSVLTAWQEN